MVENIDRILERGEKIELLVDKTERLNQVLNVHLSYSTPCLPYPYTFFASNRTVLYVCDV
jgi:hypothetical protein